MQKLLLGIAAAPVVAAAPLQPGGEVEIEKWKPPVWEATYVSGTTPGYLDAWLEASSGLGSRSKTWVYLSKSTDAESEWEIDELQTGKEKILTRKNGILWNLTRLSNWMLPTDNFPMSGG